MGRCFWGCVALMGLLGVGQAHAQGAAEGASAVLVRELHAREVELNLRIDALLHEERTLKQGEPYRRYRRVRRVGFALIGTGVGVGLGTFMGAMVFGGLAGHGSDPPSREMTRLMAAGGVTGLALAAAGGITLVIAPLRHPVVGELRALRRERSELQRDVRDLERALLVVMLPAPMDMAGGLSLALRLRL